MRSATFKIKIAGGNYPLVAVAINCPLEVLYESIKAAEDLKKFLETTAAESLVYLTASDYIDDEGAYINTDYVFCSDIRDLLKSSSLCEFLKSKSCIGYVTASTYQFDLVDDNFHEKLKKEEK